MDSLLFRLFTIKYNKSLENYNEYHQDLLNIIFIIKKVIDNNLNIDIIFNEDDEAVEKIILNNQEFSFKNIYTSMYDIFERERLLINDNFKNHMIEITRILKLNDEDYIYIYLLLVCSNYTEIKTLNNKITDAIDTTYSTLNLSYDDNDLKFYYIIEKLMIYDSTKKNGEFKEERCYRFVEIFNQCCAIRGFKSQKRTIFL